HRRLGGARPGRHVRCVAGGGAAVDRHVGGLGSDDVGPARAAPGGDGRTLPVRLAAAAVGPGARGAGVTRDPGGGGERGKGGGVGGGVFVGGGRGRGWIPGGSIRQNGRGMRGLMTAVRLVAIGRYDVLVVDTLDRLAVTNTSLTAVLRIIRRRGVRLLVARDG